ncbi:MAG TPA: hypothetical protein PLP05_06575 [Sedimentisphaerales bacterium]|nr:hypothetical protein [Sedimentisphaerales bacterium]
MQPDKLNVFDLDGTLIKVNSFKEISKSLVFILFRKVKIRALSRLIAWYFVRKLKIISHLKFKQCVVDVFEENLAEEEKQNLVQMVFCDNINRNVFDLMLKAENCVISTASPFSFASRMTFKPDAVLISSIYPNKKFPDLANFGPGKVENLKFFFKASNISVLNFYTDSTDDQELIDFSCSVFMVKNGCVIKLK